MDEKKLTDEEIVKAWECHINGIVCDKQCPYKVKGISCLNGQHARDTIDLIHRQKAEIERLTEWKDKLQDTKDELEQQLIDTGFKEYCEENKRLTEENAELQKRADELTRKAAFYYKRCKSYGIECFHDETLEGIEVE